MDEEYFLNRAEIVHDRIVTRYCYYIVIHFFRAGTYLANSYKDDEKRLIYST